MSRKNRRNQQRIENHLPAAPITNSEPPVKNGLADAIGFGGLGIGGGFGGASFVGQEQLSQPTTIFKNLRFWLVSNMRQVISEAYVELGLVQAIVDIPVDDALRGGIEIKSKQLDEDQITDLQNSLDRDDDLNIAGQAAKWNRLYGGGGIVALTDQDPSEPLRFEGIDADTNLEFRAVDMWELFWDKQNTEGYDPTTQSEDFEFYNYYGVKLHKSRVMKLKGITAPSFIRPRLRGWGVSVVEILVRSINQYLKATDLGFEVLDEFKLDVYKIKNLVNTLMSPTGDEEVRKRIAMANYQKNYQHAVVLDSEDDYDHKQLSFAGLAEAMQGIRMQVASDMRMPLTKLFGISASGFNSGEDDIEVYNAMVEAQVRNKIKYIILRMLEFKCQKMFGMVPDDLSISFKPLRVMSSEQEENVKTQKFTRLLQARQAGEITSEMFLDACNKGDLFDITIDTAEAALNLPASEDGVSEDQGADPAHPVDTNDPGANREDTQKSKALTEGGVPKGELKSGGKQPPKAQAPKNPKPPKKDSVDDPKDRARMRNEYVAPYTFLERFVRMTNSAAFDRASYEADGGDEWLDPRRREFFENPGNVDEQLWAEAKKRAAAAGGSWAMVTWLYKKLGGQFNK